MKVWNYVILMLGVLVLLGFAGLDTDPVILKVFGFVQDSAGKLTFNPSISSIADFLYDTAGNFFETNGILKALALASTGIAIGFLAKGRLENFIILPIITTVLVLFITSIKSIVDMALVQGSIPDWIGYIIAFIGVILAGGLMIALYEHFRGTD